MSATLGNPLAMKHGKVADALAGALVARVGASGADAATTGFDPVGITSSATGAAADSVVLPLVAASSAPPFCFYVTSAVATSSAAFLFLGGSPSPTSVAGGILATKGRPIFLAPDLHEAPQSKQRQYKRSKINWDEGALLTWRPEGREARY